MLEYVQYLVDERQQANNHNVDCQNDNDGKNPMMIKYHWGNSGLITV
jgi:hypothetical protein